MTEKQRMREFIKKRFPIGTEVWGTSSAPHIITKRSVFWIKPWKYEDYNDRMRPANEEDYTVDFLVHAPGRNSVVYFLRSYRKRDCLQ
jgi:hypothetical protein